MNINENIVLQIEQETKCPILEMFYTKDDDMWYVCFQEDTVINGINQIVHLDDVLEKIKEYDNIKYITNETYYEPDENTWYEQITFQWKKGDENMTRKCLKPSELEKYGQLMDNTKSYEEWEELNYYTDNICFEISECENRCNNKICQGLQTEYESEYEYEF